MPRRSVAWGLSRGSLPPGNPVRMRLAGSTRSLLCLTSTTHSQTEVRSDMRTMLALVLVLYTGAAVAQTSPPAAAGAPPTVGDKPLVQVKPPKAKAAAP